MRYNLVTTGKQANKTVGNRCRKDGQMKLETFAIAALITLWVVGAASVTIMGWLDSSMSWYKWYVLAIEIIQTVLTVAIVSAA